MWMSYIEDWKWKVNSKKNDVEFCSNCSKKWKKKESKMSDTVPEGNSEARAPSPAPSEKSIKSDVSTASSRLPKPSGMRPPSAVIKRPSPPVAASTPVSNRIGRLCTSHGHGTKSGPPPLELHKSEYYFSFALIRVQQNKLDIMNYFEIVDYDWRQFKKKNIGLKINRKIVTKISSPAKWQQTISSGISFDKLSWSFQIT